MTANEIVGRLGELMEYYSARHDLETALLLREASRFIAATGSSRTKLVEDMLKEKSRARDLNIELGRQIAHVKELGAENNRLRRENRRLKKEKEKRKNEDQQEEV